MPAAATAIEPIRAALRRVRWRLRAQAALDGAGLSGLLAAALLVGGGVVARFERVRVGGVLGGALVLVLAGALFGACRRISWRSAARRIDASHGLADRVCVALELSALPLRSAFAQAAIDDAVSRLEGVRARRAAPLRRPRHVLLSSLGMLVGMLLWVVRFPPVASGTARGPLDVAAPRDESLATDSSLFEPEREAAEGLLRESAAAGDARAGARAKDLLDTLSDIDAQRVSRWEALERLARIGSEDESYGGRDELRAAGTALLQVPVARSLAEALRRADAGEARREMWLLSQRLQDRKSGAREWKQVEVALGRRSGAGAGGEPSMGKGGSALARLSAAVAAQDRQARGRDLAQETRELVRRSDGRAGGSQTKKSSGGEGGEAGEKGMSAKEKGDGMGGAAGGKRGPSGGETGAVADDELTLREFIRRARSNGAVSEGGEGNGARGGSGRGNGKGGNQGGNGDGKEGNVAGQQGKPDGQRSIVGKKRDNIADAKRDAAKGQGETGKMAGEEMTGGGAGGERSGAVGEREGKSADGVRPWGDVPDPALFGAAAERARPARLDRVEVKAERTADGAAARPETILRASEKGFATTRYRRVYDDYAAVNDEVLEREQVPPGYRFFVKRYFQLIRPRE